MPPHQGTVPVHPPKISIDDNIRLAQGKKKEFNDDEFLADLAAMSINAAAGNDIDTGKGFVHGLVGGRRLGWFYNQVHNKAPWDYKQQGRKYQDFGNFNYGAIGSAFGIDIESLLRATGYAQMQAGTSKSVWGTPIGRPPYGDDPADQEQIRAGYYYWQRYFNK